MIHAHARESHGRNCSANVISRDLNFVMRASAVVCVVVWWKCSEKSVYTYTGGMFVLVFPLIAYGIKWMVKAIFNILSWI